MKNESLNKILAFLSVFFLATFVLSFFVSKKAKTSPKTSSTALLNPNKTDEVSSIEIGKGNHSLLLSLSNGFWYVQSQIPPLIPGSEPSVSEKSLVDKKLVEALVHNASEIRTVYKISSKSKDFEPLGLGEDSSFVSFSSAESELSKIHFGITDPLSNRISFRTENGSDSYETDDDFSQFLSSDSDYWIAGELFYEIENPETVKFSYPDRNIDFSANSSDKIFATVSHSIMSLRHGALRQRIDVEGSFVVAKIEVHSGSSEVSVVSVSRKTDAEGKSAFFVQKSSSINIEDSCFYEISEFTFNRIVEIFS